MNELHHAYLSLGSNIQPEYHLIHAVEQLQNYGTLKKLSSAWESESVGAEGPNYLNACVLLSTSMQAEELKQEVLLPLEAELGRQRSADRFAPRTMDIDIVIFDDRSCDPKYWEQAFVVVPLAEIYPKFPHPFLGEQIDETAARLCQKIWMEKRPEVFNRFGSPG
ncbi:MAG TPA: 2-amino-4-hydroxy-6-hydroxymethyldihydropteridine diphosphokinase [Anaerolineales bacterium]|nr:2-amino-4-hydroxy-6-hydroxymethyldihydropteridine diphosphokinase [Anaerolineales bacterium]